MLIEVEPNWIDIQRCPIWKVLGVSECNNCDTCDQCWTPKEESKRCLNV